MSINTSAGSLFVSSYVFIKENGKHKIVNIKKIILKH